ncbi:hypothetical protein A9Q76_04595 [Arcobacter sp. 31_11_sub10_T18]|nr:hypothetical protein A9Q76_04595 [Arcobacter sp. 31_11_sub10_T18]
MKKFAKMSLVAAVAVAGLTNVSASSLEDAVKNTEISGKVYVEFLSGADNTASGSTTGTTDMDFDVTFSTKVNDNVTSVVTLEADSANTEGADISDQAVGLDTIKFVYAKNNLTATAGRFSSVAPTDDGDKLEGLSATYKAGVASLFASYGVTNATTIGDVANLAIMAPVGPVNLEAWYTVYAPDTTTAKAAGTVGSDFGKTSTLVASTTLEGFNLAARYSATDFNTVGQADGSTLRLDASTTVSNVTLAATYVSTDKDGGASAHTDAAAANSFEQSQLTMDSLSTDVDLSIWAVSATVPYNEVTYQVAYANIDADTANDDATELRLRATHMMSSNFKVMATYSMYQEENAGVEVTDNDSTRIEFKYSF